MDAIDGPARKKPRFRTAASRPHSTPTGVPTGGASSSTEPAWTPIDLEVKVDHDAPAAAIPPAASSVGLTTSGASPSERPTQYLDPVILQPGFTSLRRSTRSQAHAQAQGQAQAVTPIKIETDPPPTRSDAPYSPSPTASTLTPRRTQNAKAPTSRSQEPSTSTPTPRKRVKVEPRTPRTAAPPVTPRRVKAEPSDSPLASVAEVPATPTSERKRAKAMPLPSLDKAHPEPARWREQYTLIERMRAGIVAPVDDMGCERPNHNTTPHTRRFHILISLMLSSQTKDAVTSAAVTSLHTTLPGGLTAASLAVADPAIVSACINKVGFWRRKTDYIRDAAVYILEREPGVGDDGAREEKGDVPRSLDGLCGIKGVGPKMAYLALQCAWEINAGIGVDVHVHRITNRLKWHKPPTQTPEQTRVNLESWLPPDRFRGINPMLVGFGQVICLPVGPRCDVCLLATAKLCPSRVANVRAEGRKEVVYTFKSEEGGAGAKVEIGYEVETTAMEVTTEMTETTRRVGVVERVGSASPLREVKLEGCV